MDKVGKYCDFVSNNSKYNQMVREDEDGFITVENAKIAQKKNRIPNQKNQPIYQLMFSNFHVSARNRKKRPFYSRNYNRNFNRTKFINAGFIHSAWQTVCDITIPNLDKKTIELDRENINMGAHGLMYKFDPKFHSIKSKKPWTLPRVQKLPLSDPDTFSDQFLLDLYEHPKAGDEDKNLFYMTEAIMLSICVLQKGLFPWNLKLLKHGNKYLLHTSAADPMAAFVNLQTQNENIQENLPDDEQELGLQCVESTLITQNFLRACTLKDEKHQEKIDILEEKELQLPIMYKYLRIALNNTNVVYTRMAVDSFTEIDGKKTYMLVKSLHGLSPSKWLKNWDANKSLELNKFYKDNKAEVCKWLVQATLVGATYIKIAIAIRKDSKERDEHKIISVENVKVSDLISNFLFKMDTSLCCLNYLLDQLVKIEEDGDYIINKVPFKQNVNIFQIIERSDEEDSDDY